MIGTPKCIPQEGLCPWSCSICPWPFSSWWSAWCWAWSPWATSLQNAHPTNRASNGQIKYSPAWSLKGKSIGVVHWFLTFGSTYTLASGRASVQVGPPSVLNPQSQCQPAFGPWTWRLFVFGAKSQYLLVRWARILKPSIFFLPFRISPNIPGFSGLFFAALFALVLSLISTGFNFITGTFWSSLTKVNRTHSLARCRNISL